MNNWQKIIDKYYGSESPLREILIRHSTQVANLALEIAASKRLHLDPDEIKCAAMLHDIGICRTYAPSIECFGNEPYICHGIIGAEILRSEDAPESIVGVALRHTGAGLTPEDIRRQQLPLPLADYTPRTLLEQLICYADKFYSKSGDMHRKSLERVRQQMMAHGEDTLQRFDRLHAIFG